MEKEGYEEKELENLICSAAENWGNEGEVSDEVWADSLKGQYLSLSSITSCLMMSGHITEEVIMQERKVNGMRGFGLVDGLMEIEMDSRYKNDKDYILGYETGKNHKGPLKNLDNLRLAGLID